MPQVRILLGAPIRCGSRGERIRTSDLLRPRQARYQAALRPAKRGPEVLDFRPVRNTNARASLPRAPTRAAAGAGAAVARARGGSGGSSPPVRVPPGSVLAPRPGGRAGP